MKSIEAIEVRIWNKVVGALALDPQFGYYAFAYDQRWHKAGIDLAPLTMPIANSKQGFVFPNLPEATFKRLPALIADALPDDFGNALIDAWMARQGIAKDAITPLDRLAYLGSRATGALEFHPARAREAGSKKALSMKELVEAARVALQGNFETAQSSKAALNDIIRVGTSAGGARAKAVIAWNPATEEIRSGQLPVEHGFEHWLLKFDGMGRDTELGEGGNYGRIEFAYSLMARAAGIDMAPCRLLEENGRAHFMTKRFDRDGTKKHHMQSLCAMNHLDYKQRSTHAYGQLFQVIVKLNLGQKALGQAFRCMVFNVMARNCDDHTKNFSFLLPENGSWQLSPAYDVTHAYNPSGAWTYQHLMSVNGKFSEITRADVLTEADRYGISNAAKTIADVQSAIDSWPQHAQSAGLSAPAADEIAKDFVTLNK